MHQKYIYKRRLGVFLFYVYMYIFHTDGYNILVGEGTLPRITALFSTARLRRRYIVVVVVSSSFLFFLKLLCDLPKDIKAKIIINLPSLVQSTINSFILWLYRPSSLFIYPFGSNGLCKLILTFDICYTLLRGTIFSTLL